MKEKISVVTPSSRWETKTIETMVIHCEKKISNPIVPMGITDYNSELTTSCKNIVLKVRRVYEIS